MKKAMAIGIILALLLALSSVVLAQARMGAPAGVSAQERPSFAITAAPKQLQQKTAMSSSLLNTRSQKECTANKETRAAVVSEGDIAKTEQGRAAGAEADSGQFCR